MHASLRAAGGRTGNTQALLSASMSKHLQLGRTAAAFAPKHAVQREQAEEPLQTHARSGTSKLSCVPCRRLSGRHTPSVLNCAQLPPQMTTVTEV